MKISEFRFKVKETLEQILSDESGAITDILLAETLGVERGVLLTMLDRDIDDITVEKIAQAVQKLSLGIPLQYVLANCYFYGKKITGCNGFNWR